MSTRGFVAVRNKDGSITGIYNHWDSYPAYLGDILMKNYKTEEIVRELIAFGSASQIREKIHPDSFFPHDFEHPQDDVCIFYIRDRDEDEHYNKAQNFSDEFVAVKEKDWEYIYVFEPSINEWRYSEINRRLGHGKEFIRTLKPLRVDFAGDVIE